MQLLQNRSMIAFLVSANGRCRLTDLLTVQEKAQEYAVCSLPSFYVFQHSAVVAKFEGLSSLTALEHLLICRTDSSTSEGREL